MLIAYIILAHNHPMHLGRLISALDGPESRFYVHIDRRVDDTPFRAATASNNVAFLADEQRLAVNWCGFSMVEATLQMLAVAHDSGAERYVFLSGTDYPTQSDAAIRRRLAPEQEFIQVDRRLAPLGNDHFDSCANRVFLGDHPLTNERTGRPRIVRLAERLAAKLPRRRYRMPVYYGASWCALTAGAVDHLLRMRRDDPDALSWFRFARSPDEMVFQTLLKASPFADRIAFDATEGDFQPKAHRAAFHYANWSRPNPNAPRIVDTEDLADILASDALFVRKIDPSRSAALLERLDLHRLQ